MKNLKFRPIVAVAESPKECPDESLVPLYVVTERGVEAQAVPETETMRVPQDGSRLELRNIARFGADLSKEDYTPVNNLDSLQTNEAIIKYASRINSQMSNPDDVDDNESVPF